MYKNKRWPKNVIIIIQYQMCPFTDDSKQMRAKTNAIKKLALGEGKEEGK